MATKLHTSKKEVVIEYYPLNFDPLSHTSNNVTFKTMGSNEKIIMHSSRTSKLAGSQSRFTLQELMNDNCINIQTLCNLNQRTQNKNTASNLPLISKKQIKKENALNNKGSEIENLYHMSNKELLQFIGDKTTKATKYLKTLKNMKIPTHEAEPLADNIPKPAKYNYRDNIPPEQQLILPAIASHSNSIDLTSRLLCKRNTDKDSYEPSCSPNSEKGKLKLYTKQPSPVHNCSGKEIKKKKHSPRIVLEPLLKEPQNISEVKNNELELRDFISVLDNAIVSKRKVTKMTDGYKVIRMHSGSFDAKGIQKTNKDLEKYCFQADKKCAQQIYQIKVNNYGFSDMLASKAVTFRNKKH